jgi:hypothetical protein
MHSLLAALALGAAAAAANAADDRLESPECRAARAELERQLEAPQARRGERLERAQRHAADVCLGRASSGSRQRSGAPEPPLAVPPPVMSAPRTAPPVELAAPAPPVQIPRPTVITTCDSAGCWDSEGRRLNQTGPLLIGPKGPCNVQGGLVTCP